MTALASRSSRVVTITGPKQVAVVDEAVGAPGPDEILVRALYSGISAGTEMNVYRGVAPQWSKKRDPDTGLFVATDVPEWQYPLAYGYALVGQIEGCGAGVEDLAVGDRVFAYVPHRTFAVVPRDEVVPLPSEIPPRRGVLLANTTTALNGVLDARPSYGDVVVVSGLGVIGLLVTRFAARCGATVVAVDNVGWRREVASHFGAAHVLAPSHGVAETVRRLTDNRGADTAIEVSGASAAFAEAIRAVGYEGLVVAMSWYGGSFADLDLGAEFHHNRVRIVSSQVDNIGSSRGPLWTRARRRQLALEALTSPELDVLLTHDFPVDEAADAYEAVDRLAEGLIQATIRYP